MKKKEQFVHRKANQKMTKLTTCELSQSGRSGKEKEEMKWGLKSVIDPSTTHSVMKEKEDDKKPMAMKDGSKKPSLTVITKDPQDNGMNEEWLMCL